MVVMLRFFIAYKNVLGTAQSKNKMLNPKRNFFEQNSPSPKTFELTDSS